MYVIKSFLEVYEDNNKNNYIYLKYNIQCTYRYEFIVRQPNPLFGLIPEIVCKVFLLIDFGSLGCTLSESAGCTPCNVERFEKFKMASKMAAVSDNSI